ncbi:MAG TPA: alpha/beta family hydrolase [Thermoanaerobaculia bacterium]|nr:alpha/beta family hydrolase [Thermoanaerobaculia bacterium]
MTETRRTSFDAEVEIPVSDLVLPGTLTVPADADGLVIFAHGSGSSRQSPRNRLVAEKLNQSGLATLLFDLLTSAEETADSYDARLRFDVPLLSDRLVAVTDWVAAFPPAHGLPLGYFGASTGAAAALVAAAARPALVEAVVSRGGRPDLAEFALARVKAPTLLIVGARDRSVLLLNRQAQRQLTAANELEVVPAATHLFEEAGKLEEVAALAASWFTGNLARQPMEAPARNR